MAQVKNSITPEHVAKFAAYMELWQDRLNLKDWRIEQHKSKADKGAMAQVERSYSDRMAAWRLGADWGPITPTDHELESTAVHELIHVLLCEVVELAQKKVDDETLMAAEHRITNTLERLLVPKGD